MQRLDGQRIVLTRSAEDSAAWAGQLESAGAEPVVLPCIRTELATGPDLAADFGAALAGAGWLLFTSRRGVDAYAALGAPTLDAATRIACVGKATAERARRICGRADVTGRGTGAALARRLVETARVGPGQRCILAVAANAGPEVERILRTAGAVTQRFDLYRTIPAEPREPRLDWSSLRAQSVIFASPTAVTGFVNQVRLDSEYESYSIGPSTSAAMARHGLKLTAEAQEPSLDSILDALAESMHV